MSAAGFVILYTLCVNGVWDAVSPAGPLASSLINAVLPELSMPPGLWAKVLIDLKGEKYGFSSRD